MCTRPIDAEGVLSGPPFPNTARSGTRPQRIPRMLQSIQIFIGAQSCCSLCQQCKAQPSSSAVPIRRRGERWLGNTSSFFFFPDWEIKKKGQECQVRPSQTKNRRGICTDRVFVSKHTTGAAKTAPRTNRPHTAVRSPQRRHSKAQFQESNESEARSFFAEKDFGYVLQWPTKLRRTEKRRSAGFLYLKQGRWKSSGRGGRECSEKKRDGEKGSHTWTRKSSSYAEDTTPTFTVPGTQKRYNSGRRRRRNATHPRLPICHLDDEICRRGMGRIPSSSRYRARRITRGIKQGVTSKFYFPRSIIESFAHYLASQTSDSSTIPPLPLPACTHSSRKVRQANLFLGMERSD